MKSSTATSTKVAQEYKSRLTLLALLRLQGYIVTDYENFSINDIHSMSVCKRMDMMVSRTRAVPGNLAAESRVYVKYQDEDTKLDNVVEDLFITEEILRPKIDTLLFVTQVEVNETTKKKICNYFNRDGYFIVPIDLANLQFNKLSHVLVPPHTILTEEELQAEVIDKFQLPSDANAVDLKRYLPEISRFDPIALCIFMKPGEVCRIERPSATAVTSYYYRVCV